MSDTVGLDLGGTKIFGARVDDRGTIVEEHRVETPTTADGLVDALAGLAARLGEGLPVGVGAAAMVGPGGVTLGAPNVAALQGLPLAERLERVLGAPALVDNDANAAAWGEVRHGAARGHDHVLVVTLGTGVGGGIVSGGRLLRGAHGFAAEIGHFQVADDGPRCPCGERGHWEAMASGQALGRLGREAAAAGRAREVVERAGGDAGAVTGVHVGDAARAGDPEAARIVAELARWVAVGLAGLVNVLDPELVVVGGGLVRLGDVLLDPVRDEFRGRIEAPGDRPEVPIVAAELGERAGAIGAAALARELAGDRQP